MSGRKLARIAGPVVAFALALAGVGAAYAGDEDPQPKTSTEVVKEQPAQSDARTFDFEWN